jgi:hypothetical protein
MRLEKYDLRKIHAGACIYSEKLENPDPAKPCIQGWSALTGGKAVLANIH